MYQVYVCNKGLKGFNLATNILVKPYFDLGCNKKFCRKKNKEQILRNVKFFLLK